MIALRLRFRVVRLRMLMLRALRALRVLRVLASAACVYVLECARKSASVPCGLMYGCVACR